MEKKDKEQSERFIKKAKELGVDDSGGLFERAISRIFTRKKHEKITSDLNDRPRGEIDGKSGR